VRYAVYRIRWAGIALILLGGLIAADRLGLFGERPAPVGGDCDRYHGKSFRVVYVVDGDTLDVDAPDGRRNTTRVRLWGVDAPETKHPTKGVGHFGPEASDFTQRACAGKVVSLELVPGKTRGNHGRLLAYVTLPDDTLLNRELVRLGYAYADPRYEHPRKAAFEQQQAAALAARRGLWRDVRGTDLPYYYRDRLLLPKAP